MLIELTEYQVRKLIELQNLIGKDKGYPYRHCDFSTAMSKALEAGIRELDKE